MPEQKELHDRQRFAQILSAQWAADTERSETYQMVYEYIQAIAILGNYSMVYSEPEKRVSRVLAKYGLLEA